MIELARGQRELELEERTARFIREVVIPYADLDALDRLLEKLGAS